MLSEERNSSYKFATQCVHISHNKTKDNYSASSMPIYQTATFKQSSATDMGEYDYTRSGNPTRTHLEQHLAKLLSAQHAFVVNSGCTALDVILRQVSSGQEVVTGDDLYGGTNRLLSTLQATYAIPVHHVDTTNVDKVSQVLNENTRIILLESPTNPLMKVCDIATIVKLVREKCPNGLVVVDNSIMTPYLLKSLDMGADIEYHSGTKYLGGHHDMMAGVIGTRDLSIAKKIGFTINSTGVGLAPFDCFLLMRGLKTLPLRMDKQQSNAQKVAEYLESKGLKVRYPGLASHPQYHLHHKQSRGGGAVLSFETNCTEKSKIIVEGITLWSISVSFGCVNSLISMPCNMSHASIPAELRAEREMPEDLVRLCVGIEDADDLIQDLEEAFRLAGL